MRVLLKISWEALAWGNSGWLDYVMLDEVCETVKWLIDKKIEVWIVVWAWNFIRWAEIEKINIDRCNADNMWMLAININTIALADVLSRKWVQVKTVNSFAIDWVAERFNKPKALKGLSKWKVVIFWWGTWNPYFTTDTAWVLRALEIEADMMIKATKVDWVYTKDPIKYNDAEFIKNATYDEIITKNLRVMDSTAIALAKDNNLILKVVSLYDEWAILKAILWKDEGTTISS
jgi:uridylate kinase